MNALSGFLDRASISSISDLADICFDPKVWGDVFNLFLRRSENNKPKPMRQLLLSLVRILQKNPREEARRAQTEYATRRSLAMITDRTESTSVKPALQALECFLTKALISGSDILRARAAINVQSNQSSSDNSTGEPVDLSMSSWSSLGQELISEIFTWVCFPDVAASAGKLVATFIKSLFTLQEGYQMHPVGGLPMWVTPLRHFLGDQPQMIEAVGDYVLPELLSVDSDDTRNFMGTLPFASLHDGTTGNVTESDIILCLITANLAANLKPSNASGKSLLFRIVCLTGLFSMTRIIDLLLDIPNPKTVALGLLDHPNKAIRIQAISIMLRSSSSTDPVPIGHLSRLRDSICYFHIEVDPRTRNAFVALAKEFVPRVMRAISSSRFAVDSCKQALSEGNAEGNPGLDLEQQNKIEDVIRENETIHVQHLSFFELYMSFLAKELRPTVSYQRHITALHVLSAVFRCACSKNTVDSLDVDLIDRDVKWRGYSSFTRSLLRPLFDLLMDPFDDVRSMAASILLIVLENIWKPHFRSLEGEAVQVPLPIAVRGDEGDARLDLPSLLSRVQSTLRTTGRADHADGVGRLYCVIWQFGRKNPDWHVNKSLVTDHLLSGLDEDINVAGTDLRLAVGTRPLHGHLIALRYRQPLSAQ